MTNWVFFFVTVVEMGFHMFKNFIKSSTVKCHTAVLGQVLPKLGLNIRPQYLQY